MSIWEIGFGGELNKKININEIKLLQSAVIWLSLATNRGSSKLLLPAKKETST